MCQTSINGFAVNGPYSLFSTRKTDQEDPSYMLINKLGLGRISGKQRPDIRRGIPDDPVGYPAFDKKIPHVCIDKYYEYLKT